MCRSSRSKVLNFWGVQSLFTISFNLISLFSFSCPDSEKTFRCLLFSVTGNNTRSDFRIVLVPTGMFSKRFFTGVGFEVVDLLILPYIDILWSKISNLASFQNATWILLPPQFQLSDRIVLKSHRSSVTNVSIARRNPARMENCRSHLDAVFPENFEKEPLRGTKVVLCAWLEYFSPLGGTNSKASH